MRAEFHPDDLRDALREARTDVWAWDLESDALSESDRGFERLGYAPGEVEHTQAGWRTLIHPDDLPAHDAAFARYLRGDLPMWECVYRIRAQGGEWRHFEERGRFTEWFPDGRPRRMIGIQTDVSDRERLRDQAGQAARRLEALASEAPGVLFQFRRETDGHAWFPYLSARCAAVTGVDPGALRDDAAEMLRRMDAPERATMLASIAESERTLQPWRLQFSLRRGDERPVMRGTASPRREPEGATLWHGYLEDATDLVALEHARQDQRAAEAASRAKTEFLGRLSHELRTPLNAVIGFTQLLENDPDDPPSDGQRQRLQLVLESGQHLLAMISDLLDLTRAEMGQIALRLVPTPVAPLVGECCAMVEPARARAGLSIEPVVDATLLVLGDAARLRQVLLNLLDNAIKYNRPGGAVRLRAVRDGDLASIEVEDDGIGIAAGELPLLFDPFWRSPAARRVGEGSGIGLAVTQSLVHAMGGRIEVDSTPGRGSLFRVRLPLG